VTAEPEQDRRGRRAEHRRGAAEDADTARAADAGQCRRLDGAAHLFGRELTRVAPPQSEANEAASKALIQATQVNESLQHVRYLEHDINAPTLASMRLIQRFGLERSAQKL
jgi:hypothetical protein